MHLITADESHLDRHSSAVAELAWSTGPASYGFQLGTMPIMTALAEASWRVPETLFGYDSATLALDGDELAGIEIGFVTPGFRTRVDALSQFVPALLEKGLINIGQLEAILQRSAQCAWLNPTVPTRRTICTPSP